MHSRVCHCMMMYDGEHKLLGYQNGSSIWTHKHTRRANNPSDVSLMHCIYGDGLNVKPNLNIRPTSGLIQPLTLPMLRLLSSQAQGHKDFWKPYQPCHFGMQWIALAEYSQMSPQVPGFQPFSSFFQSFCFGQIRQHATYGLTDFLLSTTINILYCWVGKICIWDNCLEKIRYKVDMGYN